MPAIDFPSIIGYNMGMSHHTTASRPILLAVPSNVIDRSAFLYSALDNGWVRIGYRKADGTYTYRLATRNLTLVASMGDKRDIDAIKNSEFTPLALETVVYYDYIAGSIRAFRVERCDCAAIDATCATSNH